MCMCTFEGCSGTGVMHCSPPCGGDQCICACGGERECGGCEYCETAIEVLDGDTGSYVVRLGERRGLGAYLRGQRREAATFTSSQRKAFRFVDRDIAELAAGGLDAEARVVRIRPRTNLPISSHQEPT